MPTYHSAQFICQSSGNVVECIIAHARLGTVPVREGLVLDVATHPRRIHDRARSAAELRQQVEVKTFNPSESIAIRVSTRCLTQGLPNRFSQPDRDSIADLLILPADTPLENPLGGELLETGVLTDC
jgi:hypothetical protein